MPDVALARVNRELDEIDDIVDLPELAGESKRLRDWRTVDGGQVTEAAATFAVDPTGANAVTAVTAAHAFAARLDSIAGGFLARAAGGVAAVGGVFSAAWNALKAKVNSVLQQVWNFDLKPGNPH